VASWDVPGTGLCTYGILQVTFSHQGQACGHVHNLDHDDLGYLLVLFHQNPDYFLDELLHFLETNWFSSVHYMTIHHELKQAEYLPPYSPDLNLIQVAMTMGEAGNGMIYNMYKVLEIITPGDVEGYFIHSTLQCPPHSCRNPQEWDQ